MSSLCRPRDIEIPSAPSRLRGIAPVRPASARYAHLPILEGFDWESCLAGVEPGSWYLVVFRSVRRLDTATEILTEVDDLAHAEANAAGGLLFYFRGETDQGRACLSLCLWTDRQSAGAAGRLPRHHAATRIVTEMYESFRLERYWLVKQAGGTITALPA